MAAAATNPCEPEKQFFPAIVDETSYFQLLNPSFSEANQHCSLDVLPIIFDEGSFAANEESGRGGYDVAVLSEGGRSTAAPPLTVLGFVEFPAPQKTQTCLDAQLNYQNFFDLHMGEGDSYSPCIVDVGIGVESLEKSKSDGDIAGTMKSEGLLTGLLQRQGSLKTCGKFLQVLNDQSSPLLKFLSRDKSFTERSHETSNNRWRKYKRAASFDSRKIVLFFSILSSLGTLILIYLTLRVRQATDGFVNSYGAFPAMNS